MSKRKTGDDLRQDPTKQQCQDEEKIPRQAAPPSADSFRLLQQQQLDDFTRLQQQQLDNMMALQQQQLLTADPVELPEEHKDEQRGSVAQQQLQTAQRLQRERQLEIMHQQEHDLEAIQRAQRDELEELEQAAPPVVALVAPVVVAPVAPNKDTGRKVTQRTGCWRRGEVIEPYVADQEKFSRGLALLRGKALWQPTYIPDPRTKPGVPGRCYANPRTSYASATELCCSHRGPCWLTSINRSEVSKLSKALDPRLLKERKEAAVADGLCMTCKRDTLCEDCDLQFATCVEYHDHLRDWMPRASHPEYHPLCWRPTLKCGNCVYETKSTSNMRRHVRLGNCARPVCTWCTESYNDLELHMDVCLQRDVHFNRFRTENPQSTLILTKRNGTGKNCKEWAKLYVLLA